jgi:hypothetical protein
MPALIASPSHREARDCAQAAICHALLPEIPEKTANRASTNALEAF